MISRIGVGGPLGAIVVAALVALASTAMLWNEFHAISSDAGLHYGLVRDLMFRAEGQTDLPALPVMSTYPPFAHWMSAQIGRVAGSGLLGMSAVSTASVALFYLTMFAITSRIATRAAMLALAITVAYAVLRGPIFGRMVVNNYFLGQVAGSALIPIALIGATFLHCRQRRLGADVLVMVCVQIMVCTHLLPALQLAAVYSCILLFDFWSGRNWHTLWRLLAFSLITVALTLQNPFIGTMYDASQSEAGAHINLFGSRIAQIVLVATGFFLSAKLLFASRENRYAVTLACMGFGTSLVTILHIALHAAGLTSNYSIAKTVFMTVSVVIFIGAALLAQRDKRSEEPEHVLPLQGSILILCGVMALLATRADLYPSIVSLRPVASFQEDIRAAFGESPDRQNSTVITTLWPKNIAFAIVYGDLRVPLGPATHALTGESFPFGQIKTAFAPASDPLILGRCVDRALSRGQAIAMRYDCLLEMRSSDDGPQITKNAAVPLAN